jgi:N-methylhydantoinase B/oxoprolinase/acetone carboxylase alpha subunit
MLSATASADMQVGDRFIIETPGGGGFGGDASMALPPSEG